ncbi:MAG TPA: replication-relaxation family protein [Patescibacteria group bacterium]|nr:replication-relaxation family protein [Patescibacteria group bacterium]
MNQTKKPTSKQIEILTLLYRFRFLNRHHLQKFLNHQNPGRINAWLKELTEKKYLGRIYSRKFGENIQPAIYYLKSKAAGVLRKEPEINQALLNRIYRENLRSRKFINHCLFLADIYFHLVKLCLEDKAELQFFHRTDLAKHDYLPEPLPDLYFVIKEPQGETKRYFLEMFVRKTPRYALRHRLFRFFNYYQSNFWEKTTRHPFPTILLVCSDRYMQAYLNKFIRETQEDEENYEIQFFLTTAGKIKKEGVGKKVWQAII